MNAVVLLLVFGLLTFAPQPWAVFAPLLLLIPLLQGVSDRMRRGSPAEGRVHPPEGGARPEPYSREPRDPQDPRRYRPIG